MKPETIARRFAGEKANNIPVRIHGMYHPPTADGQYAWSTRWRFVRSTRQVVVGAAVMRWIEKRCAAVPPANHRLIVDELRAIVRKPNLEEALMEEALEVAMDVVVRS